MGRSIELRWNRLRFSCGEIWEGLCGQEFMSAVCNRRARPNTKWCPMLTQSQSGNPLSAPVLTVGRWDDELLRRWDDPQPANCVALLACFSAAAGLRRRVSREHWSSFAGFNNDTAMNRGQQHARSEQGKTSGLRALFGRVNRSAYGGGVPD
jgi:hypothetical protein